MERHTLYIGAPATTQHAPKRHPYKHTKDMSLHTTHFRVICIIVAALSLLAVSAPEANAQCARGQKSFGVNAGYVTRNKSAVAGIEFQYGFSSHFRIAPGARCIFRNNDRDAIQLDLDTHYPFTFTGDRAALYPIVGLNYSWWNSHSRTQDPAEEEDVSTRKRNFGLNAGAGFEFTATPTLKLHFEARYSMVKSNSSLQLAAGIAYIF